MAMPRKKSRPIVVDGVRYRWMARPQAGHEGVWLAVEKEGAGGRVLRVLFVTEAHLFWHNYPLLLAGAPLEAFNMRKLASGSVARHVRQALALGWNPEEKGGPFVCHDRDGTLARVETAKTR